MAAGVGATRVWGGLGHSPTVSRKHYVAPTEAEFDAITAPTA